MTTNSTSSAFYRRAPRLMAGSGAVMILGGALLFGASPAAIAAGGCATGSTLLSTGVCEATFTQSGSFTPPATTIKLEALLVGAGGAATSLYAGGGGDVQIVELSASGDVTVTVGQGGSYDDSGDGFGGGTVAEQGQTAFLAPGGTPGVAGVGGGSSGNLNEGSAQSGGGAGDVPPSNLEGGPGIVVSDLNSSFFTDVDDCLGGGGAGFFYGQTTALASCGGGYSTNLVENTGGFPWNANTGSADVYFATANSGGGAGTVLTFDTTFAPWVTVNSDGADGYVSLRYSVAELPATGLDTASAGLGALLAGFGAAVIAVARRVRRT